MKHNKTLKNAIKVMQEYDRNMPLSNEEKMAIKVITESIFEDRKELFKRLEND